MSVAVNGNNQFKIKQGSLEQNLVLVPFAQERSELHWDNRNITQEVLLCTKKPLTFAHKVSNSRYTQPGAYEHREGASNHPTLVGHILYRI